jgi:AraC family transcriptional regulator of adaptative response/methylated-DNA-[protein]-cysteine methyltransferase
MNTQVVEYEQLSEDYQRIEQAIQFLEENYQRQPELSEIAANLGLSEYHFQRVFTRWVGISPKRFVQYLTKENAKRLLENRHNLLDVAYQSGLSGPGRLHDLFVACDAVTPGEFKRMGEGLTITYGFQPTPFGECLVAMTGRGICNLIFVQDNDRDAALSVLRSHWALARLVEDADRMRPVVHQVFTFLIGGKIEPLHMHLHGTNFQIKVWEALLRIPPGSVLSYQELANQIGMPGASRAVGNAVSRNPLPVLIPCHRVIRKMGDFGGYRWGTARKKALLAWEKILQETAQ